jgi:type IV pilus assembly protein PilE
MTTSKTSPAVHSAGFTLIELMVTVLIASILIGVAVPSYTTQVRKSRRTEAKTAMLDLAGREERFYSIKNTYTNVAADLGYTGAATTNVTAMPVGNNYYQVSIVFDAATATTPADYTITALPVNDQLKDTACQSFKLTNTGVQTATMTSATGPDNTTICWR